MFRFPDVCLAMPKVLLLLILVSILPFRPSQVKNSMPDEKIAHPLRNSIALP